MGTVGGFAAEVIVVSMVGLDPGTMVVGGGCAGGAFVTTRLLDLSQLKL